MSMEINRKYGQYATDCTKRLEEQREKVKEAEKAAECDNFLMS